MNTIRKLPIIFIFLFFLLGTTCDPGRDDIDFQISRINDLILAKNNPSFTFCGLFGNNFNPDSVSFDFFYNSGENLIDSISIAKVSINYYKISIIPQINAVGSSTIRVRAKSVDGDMKSITSESNFSFIIKEFYIEN